MVTRILPDYPYLLKQQESLLACLLKAEAMIEIFLAKDYAEDLPAKQHLHEYFDVIGNLLVDAQAFNEHTINKLIRLMNCNAQAEQET